MNRVMTAFAALVLTALALPAAAVLDRPRGAGFHAE